MMSDELSLSPAIAPSASDDGRGLWKWYAALAAPFVLCLLITFATGLVVQNASAISDEPAHWSLTLWFAQRLPSFDPVYPDSATTPLFHLLGAVFVRLVGPYLTVARAINALFSVAGVFALFALLRRSMRHDVASAALLTTILLTSCYFFGYSFRWLTDNLALTFCILTLGQLFRFADPTEPQRPAAFLFACLWFALTVLTRQSYVFLGLPLAVTLLASGMPARTLAVGLIGLAAAVMPFGGLVLAWHGLVPPEFQERHTSSLVNFYAPSLPLMLLGFYTPFVEGPVLWRRLRTASPPPLLWPLLIGAVGLIALWIFPLAPVAGHPELTPYFPAHAGDKEYGIFGGWIYNIAERLPKPRHNSVLFWLLFPTGLALATHFLLDALRPGADSLRRVAALFLLGILFSSIVNGICAQKYYDGIVLLFLVWQARGEIAKDPWRRSALAALILLFCAYFAVYPYTVKPRQGSVAPAPMASSERIPTASDTSL